MSGMRIPALGNLIVECWEAAEHALRDNVRRKHPDKDEESITDLLQGELKVVFDKASASRQVERASDRPPAGLS